MTARTRWSLLGSAAIVFVAAGLILPTMSRSNCGGNSAALAACNGYITVLQLWEAEHEGRMFYYDQADEETRHHLGRLPGASWIRSARLMARLDDVSVDAAADRQIIMVCDHPYDNVPQKLFGRSPMAHAVAYSTGETGLISPEQFAGLDLGGFVDLQTLSETTKAEQPTDGDEPPPRAPVSEGP